MFLYSETGAENFVINPFRPDNHYIVLKFDPIADNTMGALQKKHISQTSSGSTSRNTIFCY